MGWLSSFFRALANFFVPALGPLGSTPPFIPPAAPSIWQRIEDAIVPPLSGTTPPVLGFVSGSPVTLSPCFPFSYSLANKLYNAVHDAKDPEGAAMKLGLDMVQQAIDNLDDSGKRYTKHKSSVDGFKPELVSNNQDADVYHHVLFTVGQALQGNELANIVFTEIDKHQTKKKDSHAKEAETEVRDDFAGRAVGDLMVRTMKAGKSANYDQLAQDIGDILCSY